MVSNRVARLEQTRTAARDSWASARIMNCSAENVGRTMVFTFSPNYGSRWESTLTKACAKQ